MIGLTMIWALSVATADSPSGVVALAVDPTEATIQGPEGRVQLVVSGVDGAGVSRDLTHDPGLVYAPDDPKTLGVTPIGEVWPVGDGRAKIRVWFQGLEARVVVRTAGVQNPTPVDFATQVVPVLTRLGCNAGACHGKAAGQNGFRLSLLGSDPALDFESITRDARGRRISLAAPGSSLILRKPAAAVPHGGGRKLMIGSPEYQTLRRWLASGADASPRIASDESRVTLRLHPPAGRLYAGHTQQLRVVARRGSWPEFDVTRLTRFAGVTPDLALVDAGGRVRAAGGVGEAAVTASYAGETAVARFTVAAPATAGPPRQ